MVEINSFTEIFKVLKSKIGWIVTSVLLCGLASIVITEFFITPKYTSSAQLAGKIVSNDNSANNLNDANFNLNMINTYKDFIETDDLRTEVVENLKKDGVDITIKDLKSMISVSQNASSQIFSIDVTTTSPSLSQRIANTTSKVFEEKVGVLGVDNNVSIVSQATLNKTPSSPNMRLNLTIGVILGLVIGMTLVFLVTYMDTTLKSEAFITDTLMLNRLGIISEISKKDLKVSNKEIEPKDASILLESKMPPVAMAPVESINAAKARSDRWK